MSVIAAVQNPTGDAGMTNTVEQLRQDALALLIQVVAVLYIAWHAASPFHDGGRNVATDYLVRHWLLFPIVCFSLAGSYWLLARGIRWAVAFFLTTAFVSITAAIPLLATPAPIAVYPLLALVAVLLSGIPAGLAVGAAALVLVRLMVTGDLFGLLSEAHIAEFMIAMVLALTIAWVFRRTMITAIDWSSKSFTEARSKAQEARANRADLVQAIKQLDQAYYRLQRANAALELAWKAADAAERSKSEFVTNISHELRTPLNLIIGFSELILTAPDSYDAPLPAVYRGDLNAIYRSAQHLLTLTNDVIDLARIGMSRLVITREPVDLAQVITDAIEILHAYVEAKRIYLRLDMSPDVPILQLDRIRIRQVMLNLLTNAARFTDQGGITIVVRRDQHEVLVKVCDTGCGIAPDNHVKVFDEFFHGGDEQIAPLVSLGGIGLGLPLSKRFIELHGGRIGVDSVLGVGTTFWFTLPTIPVTSIGRHGASGAPPAVNTPALTERIVVLAGADDAIGDFLERHLDGCQFVHAATFTQAMGMARDLRARAILTGLDGDDGPGYATSPVPVIRLPIAPDTRPGASSGVLANLTKPVTRDRLRTALTRVAGPTRSVLIVDDDPRFVRLLARMLQSMSQQPAIAIFRAHTGREALTLMQVHRPDLVLLDRVMPDLEGDQVVATMRTIDTLRGVPVIMISAQDQITEQFPWRGELSVGRPDGFRLEEALAVIEALLTTLDPPRTDLALSPR